MTFPRFAKCTVFFSIFATVATAGCKKESADKGADQPSGGSGSQSTPVVRAATAEQLIGKWNVAKVEGVAESGLGASWANDLQSGTLNFRTDHTYRSRDKIVGGVSGTWSLSGNSISMLIDADENSLLKKTPTVMTVEGTQLVQRNDPLVLRYERAPETSAALKMTAAAYIGELKKSPDAADQFKGKLIELDGVVGNETGVGDQPQFIITGPPAPAEGSKAEGVICLSVDRHPLMKVWPGQTVKVRGEWAEGFMGMTRLDEVAILEAGPSTRQTIAAEQLAADFTQDPKATDAKYKVGESRLNGKMVAVTGTYLKVKNAEDGRVTGIFLGTEQAKVFIFLLDHTDMDKQLARLHVGQKYSVTGSYGTYHNKGEDFPTLRNCDLTEIK